MMGQTITLSHLAPFVDVSRRKIRQEVIEDGIPEDRVEEIVSKRLMKEIKSGIQTIQYQLITLSTTNGLL